MGEGPVAVLVGDDQLIHGRLAALATEQGWRLEPFSEEAPPPSLLVVDVGTDGADEAIRSYRARWPQALVVGYLAAPDRERWLAAQRAGADLVVNRGRLVGALRERMAAGQAGLPRRYPLLDAADAAGRLGLVARVPDTPMGPVALYRVDGALCAISDRCPHAGARLSDGELDGRVLTCPEHGSQFDVTTGERLRGPADRELAVSAVISDGGQLWLRLDR